MTINQLESDRQHALAEFLRNRRARLMPEQVGLPSGMRRRTPGLRRAEVALLAGVSPEWYTWLEQGRDIHVSAQLLESLARVLHLDANERAYLFVLALRQSPPVEMFVPPTVSPTLQQFLDHLGTTPACGVDARMNVVAGNVAYRVVFGDVSRAPERECNLIWRLFTLPMARQANAEWEQLASVYLAQFRAEYGRFISDPWWAEMIAELTEISPEFRELWARHDVLNISEGRKVFHHPLVGELLFDFLWLRTVDASDLRLLIHTPHNESATAAKIEHLLPRAAEGNAPAR